MENSVTAQDGSDVIKRQIIFRFDPNDPVDQGLKEHFEKLTEVGSHHEYVRDALKNYFVLGLQLRER